MSRWLAVASSLLVSPSIFTRCYKTHTREASMRLTWSWHHQVHIQMDSIMGPLLPGPSPRLIVLLCSLQGSYRCGPCKPGYIGDQMRGCKMERNCRDPELNPCSVNAQCIEERQGDVTCVVSHLLLALSVSVFPLNHHPSLVSACFRVKALEYESNSIKISKGCGRNRVSWSLGGAIWSHLTISHLCSLGCGSTPSSWACWWWSPSSHTPSVGGPGGEPQDRLPSTSCWFSWAHCLSSLSSPQGRPVSKSGLTLQEMNCPGSEASTCPSTRCSLPISARLGRSCSSFPCISWPRNRLWRGGRGRVQSTSASRGSPTTQVWSGSLVRNRACYCHLSPNRQPRSPGTGVGGFSVQFSSVPDMAK